MRNPVVDTLIDKEINIGNRFSSV